MEDGQVRIKALGTGLWCGLDHKSHHIVCTKQNKEEATVFRMRQTAEEHATIMYDPGAHQPSWGCEVDKKSNAIFCHPKVRWETNQSSMFRFELFDDRVKAYTMCWGPRLDQQTTDYDCVPRAGEVFTDGLKDVTTKLACKFNILPRHLDICSVNAGKVECTHHTARHRLFTGAGYNTLQRANYTALFQIEPA